MSFHHRYWLLFPFCNMKFYYCILGTRCKTPIAFTSLIISHIDHPKSSYINFILGGFNNPRYFRSSHPEVFCKKGVFRNFTKFTGKHLWTWQRCLPVNFVEFLRTPFFIEHISWLLYYLNLTRIRRKQEILWKRNVHITTEQKRLIMQFCAKLKFFHLTSLFN